MADRAVKYWKAINTAIFEEMERDETVVIMGQDIAAAGGTFGETRDLLARFGEDRVMDSPISEQALVGAGVGAAMSGLRPIVEILFMDFLGIASDQLVNQAAKQRFFSGGRVSVPLVVKAGVGTENGMGAQHSQALEGWYAGVPGLKVVWPATAADAYGLLKAAVRDDGPVLFLESLSQLSSRGQIAHADAAPTDLGRAAIARPGDSATIVTYGTMVERSLEAADRLSSEGISAEVIDLRTIMPWDRETVFASVARTNHCVVVTEAIRDFGPSAEIAAEVAECCFDDLDAPVSRVASPRVPAPQNAKFDRWRVPQSDQIAQATRALLAPGA